MNMFKVETKSISLIVSLLSAQSLFLAASTLAAEAPVSDGSNDDINARADYFRINSNYEPPPGEALHHYLSLIHI